MGDLPSPIKDTATVQERYCSVCNARKERRFKTFSTAAVLDRYQAQDQYFRLRLADVATLKSHSFPVRVCEMHFQALDGEAPWQARSPLVPGVRRHVPTRLHASPKKGYMPAGRGRELQRCVHYLV